MVSALELRRGIVMWLFDAEFAALVIAVAGTGAAGGVMAAGTAVRVRAARPASRKTAWAY
jgi:hypothetical protein